MSEEDVPAECTQAGQEARLPAPHGDPRRAGHPEVPPSQGQAAPVGLIWRIKDRRTFTEFRAARRGRSGPITVSFVAGCPADPPRVAFAIGRKVGGAVERNRLRRRLRVVVRQLAPQMRPGAYLIGTAPGASGLSVGELRASVMRVLRALGQAGPPEPNGRAGHGTTPR